MILPLEDEWFYITSSSNLDVSFYYIFSSSISLDEKGIYGIKFYEYINNAPYIILSHRARKNPVCAKSLAGRVLHIVFQKLDHGLKNCWKN